MTISRGYRTNPGVTLGPLGFLIVTNLIMWLATSFRPNLFIDLFGVSMSEVFSKPWTVLTAMFIHSPFRPFNPLGSMMHLFGNMLTLYFFGNYLIRLVGEKKFLFVYFVGGLLGNVAFLLLAPPFSTAIGASGAVFAVGGALTVLRPKLPVTLLLFFIPVTIPLWLAVIGGFLIISPGIAWQAHLGGLVLGLAAGYYWKKNVRGYYY
jgi:membrane associated rhomboid family serine protease